MKEMVVSRSVKGVYVFGPAFGLPGPGSPVGPLEPGGSQAVALPSPGGRLLAVAAGGKTAIYRPWDLTQAGPPPAPLLTLDAGEAFAWSAAPGELKLHLWVPGDAGG